MRRPALVVISMIFFIIGVLLLFEVIRPFRDMAIDGPIALGCWSVGLVLSGLSIWQRRTHLAFGVIVLALNAFALLATGLLIFALSHSKWMF